ncbi:2Fe-2S iron-sulfur cluster-binding protein [Bradyrhizobium roseum]|uniref:2Fe-2S iron-sulfur cluster-binding protein n=1 Tax=Bradyrhizobium roseum TaxID=3056648 RepID=UPI002632D38A|nr:2Fe-2S iron-sulfur cluster-binding protein [Bradyrhizobium roseus]WKA31177.1 2Fe-2S iron-sulfur cluster-binding protein [Bradyrhizobium roseus]
MSNVTFSSPVMARDITVYAIAGDRGTILAVAKAHKIPIPFDCQDGECGSCLVEVKHLASGNRKHGIALTEKEKEMLRQLGKITKEEIVAAEVNDMPPRYRLACQCFVRNEDIIVSFEGDKTLPAQAPYLTPAAKIYKGGVQIASLEEFHGFAVKVEEDAALHFDKLSKSMEACGNHEVAKLFEQLAGFSRLHLAEARKRAASTDIAKFIPPDYAWPDHETPERTALWAGDPSLSRLDALRAALVGERRGYEFYYSIAGTTRDQDIRAAAKEFFQEEAEHVQVLEAWITREEWLQKNPLPTGEASIS